MGDAYEKVRLKKQNARLRQENAEQAALLEEVRGAIQDALAEGLSSEYPRTAEMLQGWVNKLQPDTETEG